MRVYVNYVKCVFVLEEAGLTSVAAREVGLSQTRLQLFCRDLAILNTHKLLLQH